MLIFFKNILLKKDGGVIKSDNTLVQNETAIIILTIYSMLGTECCLKDLETPSIHNYCLQNLTVNVLITFVTVVFVF